MATSVEATGTHSVPSECSALDRDTGPEVVYDHRGDPLRVMATIWLLVMPTYSVPSAPKMGPAVMSAP